MARRSPVPRKKDKEAYEKTLGAYAKAKWAYEDNQTQSNRHAWQLAMANLLHAYSNTGSGVPQLSPTIPFHWGPLNDLSSAMRITTEGKDADLFHVDPSDRYDSTMRLAKEIAVGHIAKGKTKEAIQERKRWIMGKYGISRSLLNEWIRTTEPWDYDEDAELGMLGHLIDHYRENKLTGRRRKS